MRAVVLDEVNQPLRVVENHPEPPVGDGETIIEVTACGVCGSDLHVVDGDFPSPLPMVLGHEVTGVHEQLGPVMVYAPWGCRNCPQCADGLEQICPEATEAGLFTDGGYAERMRIPDPSYLSPLGDLDPINAAPLACGGLTAYRAVKQGVDTLRARGKNGRVMVIGAGGLGQYAIRYLRLLTEAQVAAVDLAADKQASALEIGAHEGLGPNDDLGHADVVLDFIGAEATLTTAAQVVKRQGLVAVVGLFGGRIPFGLGAVPHEARFMSSFWGSRPELDELLAFAHREPSIVQPVESLPLDQAQIAHDRLRNGDLKGRLVLTV